MKSMLYVLLAVVLAVFAGMPAGWAESMDHRMVSPNDLKMERCSVVAARSENCRYRGPNKRGRSLHVPTKVPQPTIRFPRALASGRRASDGDLPGTFNMGVGDKLDKERWMLLSSGKHDDHAAKNEPFCLDPRGSSSATQWSRTLGCHVCQPGG